MRARMLCAAVLTCAAACAAARPEPIARPPASGPTPAEEARRNHHQLVLEGMSAYHGLDPRQSAASIPASVSEAMPVRPPILPPVRPRLRTDALVLADLALDRGDPLDAAAQYRAWIAGRDPATAGYANVQLARAYLALGQLDRAVAALREATRAPDTEWYALVRLADLRVTAHGALAVVQQLTLIVPSRVDDIENYVISIAPSDTVAELLMRKVERAPTKRDSCRYAIVAVARGARRVPAGVDETCRAEVARAVHAGMGEPWLDVRNPSRRILEANRDAWQMALSAQTRSPEPWLAIAERYVQAKEIAANPEDVSLASRSATVALVNVLREAFIAGHLDDAARDRFNAVALALELDDRRRLWRAIEIVRPQIAER